MSGVVITLRKSCCGVQLSAPASKVVTLLKCMPLDSLDTIATHFSITSRPICLRFLRPLPITKRLQPFRTRQHSFCRKRHEQEFQRFGFEVLRLRLLKSQHEDWAQHSLPRRLSPVCRAHFYDVLNLFVGPFARMAFLLVRLGVCQSGVLRNL